MLVQSEDCIFMSYKDSQYSIRTSKLSHIRQKINCNSDVPSQTLPSLSIRRPSGAVTTKTVLVRSECTVLIK